MSRLEKEQTIALQAVSQASLLAKKMQGTLDALDVVNKKDLSPVTITDFSVQALINLQLTQTFPDIPIMGEEDSLFLRDPQNKLIKKKVLEQIEHHYPDLNENEILEAIDKGGCTGGPKGRFWVLDPIDGTRGFIRREPYCIALALIEEGEVVLGVLGCPRYPLPNNLQGAIFVATQNSGTKLLSYETMVPQEVHVAVDEQREELLYCEPHTTSATHSHAKAYQVARLLQAHPRPFRLDSQVKYAHIADGKASVYLRIPTSRPPFTEKIWDHAAGALIVQEAGGKVTDLDGRPFDFTHGKNLKVNRGIVATNGRIHTRVLDAISQLKV